MKKLRIFTLLSVLIVVFSCSNEDELLLEPTLGAIEFTPFKTNYLVGERVIFAVSVDIGNIHEQSVSWDWRVVGPDGLQGSLDPSTSAQFPEFTTTEVGIHTVRCTVTVNGNEYQIQPRQFYVASYSDGGDFGGLPGGSMIFWARGYNLTLPIEVYTLNEVKTITSLYNSTTPTCGSAGVAQWDDIPYGEYMFHAIDAAGVLWEGHYTVDAPCNGAKLILNANRGINTTKRGEYEIIRY
jgi:hypothetical protein